MSADLLHSGMGVGGADGLHPDRSRADPDSFGQEVTIMRVKMVCFKAPKFLSGLLKMLTGKKKWWLVFTV